MWPDQYGFWGWGGGSGFTPPWQTPGPTGGPQGGGGGFWDFVGDVADNLGVWDWAADLIGLPGQGGGNQGGGFSNGGGGVPGGSGIGADFLTPLIPEGYQDDPEARRRILTYYETGNNGDLKTRFINWLKTLGMGASIVSRMLGGTIFDWPGILQDLIILYYHNQPRANELGPRVVADANANATPALPPGDFLTGIGNLGALAPPTLPVTYKQVVNVPKGYVLVSNPMNRQQKAVVKKEIAVSLRLYKNRAKAPIKASEWKAIKAAYRYEKKLAKMLKDTSCNYKITRKAGGRR